MARTLATHCAQGHEWTAANTYHDPQGRRYCRECGRIRCRLQRLGCPHGYPCDICKPTTKRGIRAALARAKKEA